METVIRVIVIYLFLIVGLRVLGKREFGQMSPLEVITLLMVPELVSSALQREDFSIVDAMVAVATLFSLTVITSVAQHKSRHAEMLLSGTPVVLVHHGQLLPEAMNHERVTPDEIVDAMHKAGLDQFTDIHWAILEADGMISIVPEDRARARAHAQTGHPIIG